MADTNAPADIGFGEPHVDTRTPEERRRFERSVAEEREKIRRLGYVETPKGRWYVGKHGGAHA